MARTHKFYGNARDLTLREQNLRALRAYGLNVRGLTYRQISDQYFCGLHPASIRKLVGRGARLVHEKNPSNKKVYKT